MEARLMMELDCQLKRWAGQVFTGRTGTVNVALPRAGKWIEVEKVEIPPEIGKLNDLWRAQILEG